MVDRRRVKPRKSRGSSQRLTQLEKIGRTHLDSWIQSFSVTRQTRERWSMPRVGFQLSASKHYMANCERAVCLQPRNTVEEDVCAHPIIVVSSISSTP